MEEIPFLFYKWEFKKVDFVWTNTILTVKD